MARKKKKPFYEKIRIKDIGAEGKALARVDGLVIFTKFVIPGDVVDLQVIKKRKKYQEGIVTKIHQFSKDRTDAFCMHFGICGGCKWQFLSYEKQLEYKQKQVKDQLKRIGKIEITGFSDIIGSSEKIFYRNKLEFTFSSQRWLSNEEINSSNKIDNFNGLGFHVPGMFDKVINIEECWLQTSPSNEIRNFIYQYALEKKLTFFNLRIQEGFLRTLIIRTSSTGEIMVVLSFFKDLIQEKIELLNAVKEKFPEITSLMYVINQKGNDTLTDQEIILFSGRNHIFEEMESLQFRIGPKSFYQTNSMQAYQLYRIVRQFAEFKGDELVYDLYTGTGTIANFIAHNVKKVIGIEYIPEAIEDAKENALINGIENALFFSGDIKDVITEDFLNEHGKPDVIITDPPRAGMHAGVIKSLQSILPEKIIYVSCNPATQARDILQLSENYIPLKIQPVDMFPHTHHVENVVLLRKK